MAIEPTQLDQFVTPTEFILGATKISSTPEMQKFLEQLPITPQEQYEYDEAQPEAGWQPGKFHWIPVGRRRGNAGQINLANHPVNPIAERVVNGMEAIIELARQRELQSDAQSENPPSPRDAVKRYFGLCPMDEIPKLDNSPASRTIRETARDLARKLRVDLSNNKESKEFVVSIGDDGIGQPPSQIHRTLLSLGATTKADKPYMIGVFGQGGSSAFAVSSCSWLISRRAPDLLEGHEDGAGWTVIRQVIPVNRRDVYYAYLAAHPDGRVPSISAQAADSANIRHGTRFSHIGYDFGKGGSAITRQLYTMLNHALYNPILPFELDVGGTKAVINGNAYRLSSLGKTKATAPAALDKTFPPQSVSV